ncbi:class I SAM-dependent methyltransferase [Plastoroseomonas hellenica]|uniref:class I SAM-dependent methyltransferase n=1 Tax=Plastoroseomonas hellenica TaxID=2687306 RepID=UPI001BA7DEBB|nr:class I SAM-dependent methyltransferase [Plastoroseomonas hellenica]
MIRTANAARFWDRTARKYAASGISDMAGYERTLARTRHHLRGDETAIEFGCGTGTTALKLAPFLRHILATDISGGMIAIARERAAAAGHANAAFEVATPDAAPWPDASFDVVLGFNLLHLVANREAALRGIHRLLQPGGLFISKTPCLKEMNPLVRIAVPVMQVIGKAPYVASFSVAELERAMAAVGFDIIERAYHASRGRDARPFLVARKR